MVVIKDTFFKLSVKDSQDVWEEEAPGRAPGSPRAVTLRCCTLHCLLLQLEVVWFGGHTTRRTIDHESKYQSFLVKKKRKQREALEGKLYGHPFFQNKLFLREETK